MTKMTQKDYFNEIIALASANDRQDIVDFAESRIDAIDRKSANRKPTKTQKENEVLSTEIMSVLSPEGATVTEIMSRSASLATLSNQKVSAVVRSLVNAGKVVKTKDGKKSLFSLA